jgi:hypothetical protein
MFLDARVDVGESADSAGDGAGGDSCAHAQASRQREFGVGLRQFDTEGRRLGMDAMAAADGDVSLCSKARRLRAASNPSMSASRMSLARVSCTARQVSSTSDEVMPWWMKRASGPTNSARW